MNDGKSFSGQVNSQGFPEGVGRTWFPEGEIYEGGWFNMQAHGFGRIIYLNGDQYVGNWKNG
jgi:hypothetical protein